MSRIARVSWAIVAAAGFYALSLAPLGAAPESDRKAPSVRFKTLDGKAVKLADRRGRIVLVDFWASWCAPCKATFPALNLLALELKDRGVDVLAVSVDEKRKDLDAFLADVQPSLEVLSDARADAAGAFGVSAIPSMFVIDAEGTIKFSHPNYGAEVIEVVKREILTLAPINSSTPQLPTPN